MIEKILLPNRYGDKNYLILQSSEGDLGYYKLVLQDNLCIRVIAGEDGEFNNPFAIDPSGGPYMSIGFEIADMTLVKIENDKQLILIFKQNE